MKQYHFEIVLDEGSDEFWESLKDKSGCDEVRESLISALASVGWFTGIDATSDNCTVTLIKYTNEGSAK